MDISRYFSTLCPPGQAGLGFITHKPLPTHFSRSEISSVIPNPLYRSKRQGYSGGANVPVGMGDVQSWIDSAQSGDRQRVLDEIDSFMEIESVDDSRAVVKHAWLGFATDDGMQRMRGGKSPTVKFDPYAGETLTVHHIIPRAVAPSLDRVLANLELMPHSLNIRTGAKVGKRQLDLAKRLRDAGLLSETDLTTANAQQTPRQHRRTTLVGSTQIGAQR